MAEAMSTEDWHKSPKFLKLRMFRNLAFEMDQKAQSLEDLLAIFVAEEGPLAGVPSDKVTLVERQIRVIRLEAQKLTEQVMRVEQILSPRKLTGGGHGGPEWTSATSSGT
jgi:hypothetical protein